MGCRGSSCNADLINEIKQIELEDPSLHIGEPSTIPDDDGYWGGLTITIINHTPTLSYHVNILQCTSQHLQTHQCIWSFIDNTNAKYNHFKHDIIHHLGGAFFEFESQDEKEHTKHCQMVLEAEQKEYTVICQPSEEGSRSAFQHKDLINYNIFMNAQFKFPHHDDGLQHMHQPYIYFDGKQTCNQCTRYAVNNGIGWKVWDPDKFAKLQLKHAKNKVIKAIQFEKDPSTKTKIPTFFPPVIAAKGLQEMGMKVIHNGPGLHQFDFVEYRTERDDLQFVLPDDEIGLLFNFRGIYKRTIKEKSTASGHSFVFKYIAGHWYGFDANAEQPIGPEHTLTECMEETFNWSNHYFTWTAEECKKAYVSKKNIGHNRFPIDIEKILNGDFKNALEESSAAYKLSRKTIITPYIPQYSPYIDYNNNLYYEYDAKIYLEYGLLLVILMIFVACIWCIICCIFGLISGYFCKTLSNNYKVEKRKQQIQCEI